jgi:predicted KAP-like P-loop ATPase
LRRVGEAVATCEPPHVLGVHGDWGSGKTSFLHQLQLYLTGTCPQQPETIAKTVETDTPLLVGRHGAHVTVVWFEAWRYQNEQAPIVALLQEIRTQLPWYSKALSQTKKLGEVTIRSALLAFEDLTKKIGVQASKIEEVGNKWEQEHLATVLPSHMVRQHLEHALQTLLGDTKPKEGTPRRRLVVMVDDLDRCAPEAAYKLIEGIKIYLNLPNCVFVLGMNQRIIEDAIAGHIPKLDNPALQMLRAREYLDKLCQTIVHLPLARQPVALLRRYLEDVQDFSAEPVCKILEQYACLPANPRKIKAFANLLRGYLPRFATELGDPQQSESRSRQAAIFTCLYHFHPELYRVLEAHPRFYLEIRLWAQFDKTVPDHPAFKALSPSEREIKTDASTTTATPQPLSGNAYADPVEGNVFRIQKLIAESGPLTEDAVVESLVR